MAKSSSTSILVAVIFFGLMIVFSSANKVSRLDNNRNKVKEEDLQLQGFHPRECMDAIKSVEGCFEAIHGLFNGHLGELKHSCCKTLNGLSKNCWSTLFPRKFYLRITIKLMCLL
ncbi:Prolamin_like domain-containing protein [Raphanus sativus]|nr:Prolamin_like domain-containing protein [Raphanus sativus]